MPGQSLNFEGLVGRSRANAQGLLSSAEPCKALHALWKTKTLHTYSVLVLGVVLIVPLSTGLRVWVRAV